MAEMSHINQQTPLVLFHGKIKVLLSHSEDQNGAFSAVENVSKIESVTHFRLTHPIGPFGFHLSTPFAVYRKERFLLTRLRDLTTNSIFLATIKWFCDKFNGSLVTSLCASYLGCSAKLDPWNCQYRSTITIRKC